MYHIYISFLFININIPLSHSHSTYNSTTYYTILYHHHWKKKNFFSSNYESNCINTIIYHLYPLFSFVFFYFYYRISTLCYLLSPLLSMSITATTSELSINWNQNSLMTLRWVIPWNRNLIVNLLNKVYLNLSF
jgi:hypothetical protein